MPPAPQYESFAAVTMLVLGLLIVLARASQGMFEGEGDAGRDAPDDDGASVPATGAARIERHRDTGLSRAERIEREVLDDRDADENPWENEADTENPWGENAAEADAAGNETAETDAVAVADEDGATAPDAADAADLDTDPRPSDPDELELTTGALLANVAVSQGVFGLAILGAAWLADVPLAALGVGVGDPWSVGPPAVALGVAVGAALYVANELSSTVVDAAGVEYSEGLREALAPDSLRGWAVLLGLVLPVIAGFEELLFRAALIGAFAAGFGVSPWALAVFSTVAFAIGHGAQGPGGVAVTGLLGFALAAAFVLSGSLLVVVVAHYLVNALEFVVHEGFGVEWAGGA
jgi:membrane protease YdiL (CAAX protease family)